MFILRKNKDLDIGNEKIITCETRNYLELRIKCDGWDEWKISQIGIQIRRAINKQDGISGVKRYIGKRYSICNAVVKNKAL